MARFDQTASELASLLSSLSLVSSLPLSGRDSSQSQGKKAGRSGEPQRNFDTALTVLDTIDSSGVPSRVINDVGFRENDGARRQVYSLGGGLTSEVVMHAVDRKAGLEAGHESARTLVALKMYRAPTPLPKDRKAVYGHIARELKVLTHPLLRTQANVVRLLFVGWNTGNSYPILATELGTYGSLEYVIKMPGDTPTRLQKQHITIDIACGLQAIHIAGFVHGDLKPDNIIVSAYADPQRDLIAKLADFGGSVEIQQGRKPVHFTHLWCSPELTMPTSHADLDWQKADIYSYGLIVASLWGKYTDLGAYGAGRLTNPSSCFLAAFIPYPDDQGIGDDVITLMKCNPLMECDPGSNRVVSVVSVRLDATEPEIKPVLMDLLTAVLQRDPIDRPDRLLPSLVPLAEAVERSLSQEMSGARIPSTLQDDPGKPRWASYLWPNFVSQGGDSERLPSKDKDLKRVLVQQCEDAIRHVYTPDQFTGTASFSSTVDRFHAMPKQIADIPEDPGLNTEPREFMQYLWFSLLEMLKRLKEHESERARREDNWVSAQLAQYVAMLEIESFDVGRDHETTGHKWLHVSALLGVEESVYLAAFLLEGSRLDVQFPTRFFICLLALCGSHEALRVLADHWPSCLAMVKLSMRLCLPAYLEVATSSPGFLFTDAAMQFKRLPPGQHTLDRSLSLEEALMIGAKNEVEQWLNVMVVVDCRTLLCRIAESRLTDAEATSLAKLALKQGAQLDQVTQRSLPVAPVELYPLPLQSNLDASALSWAIAYGKIQLALEIFSLHVEHDTPIPDFVLALSLSGVYLYHDLTEALLLLQQGNPDMCKSVHKGVGLEEMKSMIDSALFLAEQPTSKSDQVFQQKIRHGANWRAARKATIRVLLAWGAKTSVTDALERDDVDTLELSIEQTERNGGDVSSFLRDGFYGVSPQGIATMSPAPPPAWWAIMILGATNCFQFLLRHFPSFLESPNFFNDHSPLHLACSCGNNIFVRLLLDAGCDWKALDKDGMTPLVYALGAKNIEAADLIESHAPGETLEVLTGYHTHWQSYIWRGWHSNRDTGLIESLKWIARRTKLQFVVQSRVSKDIVPVWEWILGPPRPTQEFAQRRDLEMMEFLLNQDEFSCQINTWRFEGRLLLHTASCGGHVQVVQMLLHRQDLRVDVNASVTNDSTVYDLVQFVAKSPEPPQITAGGSLEVQKWHNDLDIILRSFKARGVRSMVMDMMCDRDLRSVTREAISRNVIVIPPEERQRLAFHSPYRSETSMPFFAFAMKWPPKLPGLKAMEEESAVSPPGQKTELSQEVMAILEKWTQQYHAKVTSADQYQDSPRVAEPRPGNTADAPNVPNSDPTAKERQNGQSGLPPLWYQDEYKRTIQSFVRRMKASRHVPNHNDKGKGKEAVEEGQQTDSLAQRLQEAVLGGQYEEIGHLAQQGASVNEPAFSGLVPLHLALLAGDSKTVDLLISHGADPNRPLPLAAGVPLHLCIIHDSVPIAEILLRSGADPAGTLQAPATPLQFALALGSSDDMVNLLLETGGAPADLDLEMETLHARCALMAEKIRELQSRTALLLQVKQLTELQPGICPFNAFDYDTAFLYGTAAGKKGVIMRRFESQARDPRTHDPAGSSS